MKELVKKILASDKRALARSISLVENGEGNELLNEIYKYTGKAYRIGITGPPGAGKSTLTNCLIKILQKGGYKIGVIAIDPTSPFTGGALLGDRVRMQETGMLENVFIRSMATRGSLGGLSKNVNEACDVLDASGKDFIIIETVGVGQSELDIADTADTTIVVLVPESGDSIQAMKAGLMEIADIFVLNKSDRLGADMIASTLKNIIHLKDKKEGDRDINVLQTVAEKGEGVEGLLTEIFSHKEYLESTGKLRLKRKEHIKSKIVEMVNFRWQKSFWNNERNEILEQNLDEIIDKKKSPYQFIEVIINER